VVILLHALVASLYAATAWARWPRSEAVPDARRNVAQVLLPIALLLHAIAIWKAIVHSDGLDFAFVNALSLVAGLAVLAAWLTGVMRTLPRVAAVVLPVAAVCALLPPVAGSPHRIHFASEPWAAAHIAVALCAYALFVVVAMQALVTTGLEKRLHRGLPDTALHAAPPQLFGKPVTFTHKNVFSVAGWLAFAVLLFGRWRYGWRGRTALKWILGGTLLLVLGYLGSKFVLELVLRR
jgi:ABC-type uncharacterized transport system permease subunit